MVNKILVCALCSQDFTRRYSADRHNQNLHHGQGKIVRMIDYVIGRIAGEYNAANPLAYRSSYRQQASPSTRYDAKAFRFPLDAKVTVAHDTFQKSSAALPLDKEQATAQQQPNSNSVQPSTTATSGFTTKFEGIQELARTLFGPENAEALLKELDMAIIENGGKDEILDGCLEKLRNKMNMKIAYHHFYNSAASKDVSKHIPLHGHDVADLFELSRAKLEKIEELLTLRDKNPNAVFEKIKQIIEVCNAQPLRQNSILDLELNSLGGTPQTNK